MDPVARLTAIEDIKQLKARYFRTIDTRDWGGMTEVFCRDAKFDWREALRCTPLGGVPEGMEGAIMQGRDFFISWVRDAYANLTGAHYGHGHEVVIESETEAHGIVAMEDYIFGPDRKTELFHAAGHYHERYRFEDGAWRIAEMKISRLFIASKINQTT